MAPQKKQRKNHAWLDALRQTAEYDPQMRFQLLEKLERFLSAHDNAMGSGNALWEEICAPGEEGISFVNLADALNVSESAISQKVNKWAAAGLVEVKKVGKKSFAFPNWNALYQLDNFNAAIPTTSRPIIKALTNPLAFIIYTRLIDKPMTVGELCTSVSAPTQSNVSMALKAMESAGIIETVSHKADAEIRAYRQAYCLVWFWDSLIAAAKDTFVKHNVFSLVEPEIK